MPRGASRTKYSCSCASPRSTATTDILGTDDDIVNKGIETEAEREILRSAVAELCDREREIMEMRFGLINGREMTQKEVADCIGISQSYISRLEKKIIKKLRIKIESVT